MPVLMVMRLLPSTSSAHTLADQSPTCTVQSTAQYSTVQYSTPVTHREEVLAEGGVALEAAHGAVVAAEGVDDHLGLHLRLLGAAHNPALLRPHLAAPEHYPTILLPQLCPTMYLAGMVGSYSRMLGVKALSLTPWHPGSWLSGSRSTVSTGEENRRVSHH